jgi:AcrR family transcriptional regulator
MNAEGARRCTMPRHRPKGSTTADALVRAGRRLFPRHGYDGTSVRALTRAAHANLGAITYHFGSKRKLYGAVVASCVEPFAAQVIAAATGQGPPMDRLEAALRAFFAALASTPEMPLLLLQEMAVGRDPPVEAVRAVARILSTLRSVVEEGQTDGTIRDADPTLMVTSLVAQPLHLAVGRRMFLRVAELDDRDPAERQRLVDHAVAFVRAALESRGEAGA